MRKEMWKLYFCDSGEIVYWSTRRCFAHFGKGEFWEAIQGYNPSVVITKVPNK